MGKFISDADMEAQIAAESESQPKRSSKFISDADMDAMLKAESEDDSTAQTLKDAAMGGVQGLTFGGADELAGAIGALPSILDPNKKYLEEYRDIQKQAEGKFTEAEEAIKNGAEELDMVINIGKLKVQDYNYVYSEIKSISDLSKKYLCTSKLILETCLLSGEEKVIACLLAKEAGLNFVKTSTGFSKSGATVHDVALMKFVVGDKLQVKASGGIRSYDDAISMINAGATRLGASAGVKIIAGQKSDSNY